MATRAQSRTGVDEIADGIFRINTPIDIPGGPGKFSFNQYLIRGERPLLFHTGLRRLFPDIRDAVATLMPLADLRFVGLSHFEADECGALNEWLAVAPHAEPVCGRIAAMVSVNDYADRPPRALADNEALDLGGHVVRWFDTPHVPHAWECGLMMEDRTRTFLCGDLFTRGGRGEVPLTEDDILEASEAFRAPMDYYAHAPDTGATLERLAALQPQTLACMHGSAWRGDGAALLRELAKRLARG
jgi:flavorubredoxin